MENEVALVRNGKHTGLLNLEKSVFNINRDETEKPSSNLGDLIFITSYPPRECGIASYSQNLINALNNRFVNNYKIKVYALQSSDLKFYYPPEVISALNTSNPLDFIRIADEINDNKNIQAVVLQHEFDLFKTSQTSLVELIKHISKPVITVFHTVIANPSEEISNYVQQIASASKLVIVLADVSEKVLKSDYNIDEEKVEVIAYGTRLVTPSSVPALKEKYKLTGKTVLSTIGLLSPGKGIENTLEALPTVVKAHPEIMFLVIGKTHPEELTKGGEKYRIMLESRVKSLKLQNHVSFMNVYLSNEVLTEYFQLSDICIFSSTNVNRPMSGMFSLAISCGCPIISSPTPYAYEFLANNAGFIYNNEDDLASKINILLDDPALRKNFSENVQKKSISAIWENSALVHKNIIDRLAGISNPADFKYPPIKLDFLKELTDRTGILHSTYKGEPDLRTGYTLDDNALALFVYCMHYKFTGDINDITYIKKYLKFIYHCYQSTGVFFKYLDHDRKFTAQNHRENLEDSQAKAIWSLGYLFSMKGLLPTEMTDVAGLMIGNSLPEIDKFTSGKSIALAIKGLYYYFSVNEAAKDLTRIKSLANKLVQMYKVNSQDNWKWFEPKFTHAASIIPGALLNTWLISGDLVFKDIAKESFEFLYSRMFNNYTIDIKSREEWIAENPLDPKAGDQPCDIAFNVITSSKFYLMCKENEYFYRMDGAFKWFLGNNRLNQMVYNSVSGGCFDGLDKEHVNLNQSADSALCFILARMIVEKYKFNGENHINNII
jgi:glycosyltransferase involved in cell wall biosynthesis